MCGIISNERGVGVVAALLFILILAALGYVALALAVEDVNGAAACVDSELALGVAQAGLQLGVTKLSADGTWTGVASPGKPVGRGSFTVAVTTTDENGVPLAGGQKMVRSTGRVGNAVRQVRELVAPAGGSAATVYATAQGNAVSIPSQENFLNIANICDGPSGPNNTWGQGGFDSSDNESGIFASWTASGLTGTVTSVEALLYGYLSGSLDDDYVELRVYFNGTQAGGVCELTTSALNARVGSANEGWWTVDVTSTRSWALADFGGDLELYVSGQKRPGDDGRTLLLDAVGFRITTSGGGTGTAFKEITT